MVRLRRRPRHRHERVKVAGPGLTVRSTRMVVRLLPRVPTTPPPRPTGPPPATASGTSRSSIAGDPSSTLVQCEASPRFDPTYVRLVEGRAKAEAALGPTDAARVGAARQRS